MTLSADRLNLRSPYRLVQINDMTFSFVTDKQIYYNVGFYKDTQLALLAQGAPRLEGHRLVSALDLWSLCPAKNVHPQDHQQDSQRNHVLSHNYNLMTGEDIKNNAVSPAFSHI